MIMFSDYTPTLPIALAHEWRPMTLAGAYLWRSSHEMSGPIAASRHTGTAQEAGFLLSSERRILRRRHTEFATGNRPYSANYM